MVDDERIAALIDGRLSEAQRDETLRHLLTVDEDRQVWMDTVCVLREMEEEE
jgi:hypothetical protein